ncbi:FtsW/RodA/SpoVE family cell cycle protein [Bacteroidales bacterium OttesenSCG-928-L03]|nr:FtsW/RodA/SpoVE family cell cycle protein [Bacteroidales bacterium OttesenSCG-928-L03]
MNTISKIFRGDKVIWVLFMFFCFISLIEVYSASSTLTFRNSYWLPILKHAVFLLLGTGMVLVVHNIKPKYFSLLMVGLPVSWGLLILVKLLGDTTNDAARWLEVGGFTFQPSEMAKLCLIATTAFILSKQADSKNNKAFRWIVGLSIATCAFIFTENFSTAALLFIVVYLMMFVGQVPLKKIGLLTVSLIGILALFIAFLLLAPDSMLEKFNRGETWKNRFLNFSEAKAELNPDTYVINDDNFQRSHAQIAISEGGIFGKLPGNSTQRDVLPQAYSDFIYAIIIEEMGLVGALAVLFLYIILLVRAGQIASRCEKLFPKYLVLGSSLLIVMQALSNMAVAVGLIPITGQPLPLISKGGTSIIITCVYIGIILSVSRFENPKGIQTEEAIAAELAEQEQLSGEKPFWDGEPALQEQTVKPEET